jgi:hypothetical protein
VAATGSGVQVSVGVITSGVGVSSGVDVKVGLRVLVGVGSGARAIMEPTEQPKVMAIAAKGRINNRVDFVCTKRNLPFVGSTQVIIPHCAGKTKKNQQAVSHQRSAFSLCPTGKGLYKRGWVCYDIDGRGSRGERGGFVKAGF